MVGGLIFPITCAKFVSEKFKEKHSTEWTTGKDYFNNLLNSYRTEARWAKAVQHLRDDGKLEDDPRDIGNLIKEIHRDILDEEKEAFKEELWKLYHRELLGKSIKGFPEWYKLELVKRQT